MNKTFKRSLIGTLVAGVASTAAINAQAAQLTDNIQLYGQAAVSAWVISNDKDGANNQLDIENESRIGLRGTQSFTNFGPDVIWQIETGNVGDDGETGTFGARDSFIGFQFDAGKFRFGRLTTPAYDIVDWPYTNPGLGNVFDWNTDIKAGAHLDRVGDHFRWDSKNYGGFTYALSTGQGQSDIGEMFYSVAAHYTTGMFTLHAGYQTEGKAAVEVKADASDADKVTGTATGERSFYIIGGEMHMGNGLGFVAAFKHMETDYTDGKDDMAGVSFEEQDAVSLTAQYATGPWLYKVGYAMTTDMKSNVEGRGDNTADQAITGRVLYSMDPSAVIYSDVRAYDFDENEASSVTRDQIKWGIGVEYYF